MNTGKVSRITAIALGLALATTMASAQALNSGAQTIALNATLAESLTLSLSANAVNFTLAAGTAANAGQHEHHGDDNVGAEAGTDLRLASMLTSPMRRAALTDGEANNIPSSAFFISDNAGASTALTNTVAFGAANGGLQLANVAITGANKNASRTD